MSLIRSLYSRSSSKQKLKFPGGGGKKGKRRGSGSVAGDGQICHFMLIISRFKKMSCR